MEELSSSDIVQRKVDAVWQRLQNFEPLVQKLLRLFDERLTKQERGLAQLLEQRVSAAELRACVQRCDLMQQAVGALSQAHSADMRVALGRLHLLEAKAIHATEPPSVDSPVPVANSGADNAAQVPAAEPKQARCGRPWQAVENPAPAVLQQNLQHQATQDRKQKPNVSALCRVFGDRQDPAAQQLAAGGGKEGMAAMPRSPCSQQPQMQQEFAGTKAQQLDVASPPTTPAAGRHPPTSPRTAAVAGQQMVKLEPVVTVGVVRNSGGVRAKISQLEMLSTMVPKAAAVS